MERCKSSAEDAQMRALQCQLLVAWHVGAILTGAGCRKQENVCKVPSQGLTS